MLFEVIEQGFVTDFRLVCSLCESREVFLVLTHQDTHGFISP